MTAPIPNAELAYREVRGGMKPNAELAWRVIDHIDAHPEQWWQLQWISRSGGSDCRTAGCFAGWACMLSGDKPHWESTEAPEALLVDVDGGTETVGVRAAELLGIAIDQKFELFHEYNTREDLGRLVAEIFGPRPVGSAS